MKRGKIFSILLAAIFLIALFSVNSSYESIEKFDSEIYQQAEEGGKANVIINFKEEADENAVEDESIRHIFEESVAAEVSMDELLELNSNPDVDSIIIDKPIKAFLQESIPLINATPVWDMEISGVNITGKDETICIIDTGINFLHSDLIGRNKTCVIDCFAKACVENCSLGDDNGHGTHVAGIAAARGKINGVVIETGLIGVKVLDTDANGQSSDMDAGIQWCVNNSQQYNISVISMSIGTGEMFDSYCDNESSSTSYINLAVAKNISVVIATGNDGNKTHISAPACVKNATAVGMSYDATIAGTYSWPSANCSDSSITADEIVCASNRNSITDLFAPGALINSTSYTGAYEIKSGTSMATPHVSGAVALIRQLYRLQENRVLAPLEIENILKETGKQITWKTRKSPSDNAWMSVAYGNGTFVAVSATGTNRVMTSSDGVIWTNRTASVDNYWTSVTYGNGSFVAVSAYGAGNRVMTSSDGINWTTRNSAADNFWMSVVYGNGSFVAVSATGTNRVMTSSDGVIWTTRKASANNEWNSVVYGNGSFVAVADSGVGTTRVMSSSDGGLTWVNRSAASNNSWFGVTYGNEMFVAVSNNGIGNRVMTSSDGINWTNRTSAADNSWLSVTYGNDLFVAVASSGAGNRVMTSSDGINWTTRNSAANNAWYSVTYGNGLFVAVGEALSGTDRIMTSEKSIFSRIDIYSAILSIFKEDIVISEIMKNPENSFNDYKGEYIELYNADNKLININGWTIKDNETDFHIINSSSALNIHAGKFLILCRENNRTENGNFSCDYKYGSDITLGNDNDEIILIRRGIEIDRVEYNDSDFPDDTGRAMELVNYSEDNNDGSNWMSAIASFGQGDFGTPGSANSEWSCVNNWTAVTGACQPDDRIKVWFNDTNSCFLKISQPANITYNNSCDYDGNGIIGSINSTNVSSSISNFSLDINGTANLSESFNGTKNVKLKNGNDTLIEFNYNFSLSSLNLDFALEKQSAGSSNAFILISNLNLSSGETKTVYMERILNGTGICVKDAEISSISEVSGSCTGASETWLSCPNSSSSYTCSLTNDSKYKITGLSHSGIKELGTYCGDGFCNGNEDCSSCSTDCGSCSSSSSSNSDSSSNNQDTTIITNSASQNTANNETITLGEKKENKGTGIMGAILGLGTYEKIGVGIAVGCLLIISGLSILVKRRRSINKF